MFMNDMHLISLKNDNSRYAKNVRSFDGTATQLSVSTDCRVIYWCISLHVHNWLSHFSGCKPEQQMMYAGSMKSLVEEIQVTKVVFSDSLVFDYTHVPLIHV